MSISKTRLQWVEYRLLLSRCSDKTSVVIMSVIMYILATLLAAGRMDIRRLFSHGSVRVQRLGQGGGGGYYR